MVDNFFSVLMAGFCMRSQCACCLSFVRNVVRYVLIGDFWALVMKVL